MAHASRLAGMSGRQLVGMVYIRFPFRVRLRDFGFNTTPPVCQHPCEFSCQFGAVKGEVVLFADIFSQIIKLKAVILKKMN